MWGVFFVFEHLFCIFFKIFAKITLKLKFEHAYFLKLFVYQNKTNVTRREIVLSTIEKTRILKNLLVSKLQTNEHSETKKSTLCDARRYFCGKKSIFRLSNLQNLMMQFYYNIFHYNKAAIFFPKSYYFLLIADSWSGIIIFLKKTSENLIKVTGKISYFKIQNSYWYIFVVKI